MIIPWLLLIWICVLFTSSSWSCTTLRQRCVAKLCWDQPMALRSSSKPLLLVFLKFCSMTSEQYPVLAVLVYCNKTLAYAVALPARWQQHCTALWIVSLGRRGKVVVTFHNTLNCWFGEKGSVQTWANICYVVILLWRLTVVTAELTPRGEYSKFHRSPCDGIIEN
jgi:hypothetical protein